MSAKGTQPQQRSVDLLAWRRTAARLPLTLRPSVNEQLDEWEMLFPFEQNRLRNFLGGVDSFSTADLNALTAQLRDLEAKMGVARWDFSENSNTLENSELLARSAYYAEWRRAVERLFAAIEARASSTAVAEPEHGRVIVAVLPASLLVDEQTAWNLWKAQGREVAIQGDARQIFDLLLTGSPGIGELLAERHSNDPADAWLIDAAAKPGNAIAPAGFLAASCLNFSLLNPLRERFLAELNTIPRDTDTASQTMLEMRQKDWSRWWPTELAGQDRLRNFVVDLYLSGNGALIFSDAFVEWAASEVLRRARPHVLVARFGVRSRPKPFTSIAIFEDQTKVSTIPDTDDPVNSAVDAAILAPYIWLSALRYAEYERALCLCISEHLNSAWVVAPSGSDLERTSGPLSPAKLHGAILHWLMT